MYIALIGLLGFYIYACYLLLMPIKLSSNVAASKKKESRLKAWLKTPRSALIYWRFWDHPAAPIQSIPILCAVGLTIAVFRGLFGSWGTSVGVVALLLDVPLLAIFALFLCRPREQDQHGKHDR